MANKFVIEILSDLKSGSWTLSASGLFLLKTLYEDYKIEDFNGDITLKKFDDEYEREMYQKFWKEMNELKRGLIA